MPNTKLEAYKKSRKARTSFWRLRLPILFKTLAVSTVLIGAVFFQSTILHSFYQLWRFVGGGISTVLGLELHKIYISSTVYSDEKQLHSALNKLVGEKLLTIDLGKIEQKLLSYPWVKKINLRIKYPNSLEVHLTEKTPLYLWEKSKGHYLAIDKKHHLITRVEYAKHHNLPVLQGIDAHKHTSEIMLLLNREAIKKLFIQSFFRTSLGGWQIKTAYGTVIYMPEKLTKATKKLLFHLAEKYDILNRKLDYIDLRVDGKIIVKPSLKNPLHFEGERKKT